MKHQEPDSVLTLV